MQTNERGQTRHFFFDPQRQRQPECGRNTALTYIYTYDPVATSTTASANVIRKGMSPRTLTMPQRQHSADHQPPRAAPLTYANFTAYNRHGHLEDANGHYTVLGSRTPRAT